MQQTLRHSDEVFLRASIAVGLGVLMVMPFYAFFSTWLGTALGPLVLWKSLSDIVVGLLGVMMTLWLALHRATAIRLWRQWSIRLAVLYVIVALGITLAQSSLASPQTQAGVIFGLRYITLFGVMLAASMSLPAGFDWKRAAQQYVTGLTIVLAVLTILQVFVLPINFLQQFGYDRSTTIAPSMVIDDNPDARRAFVTMRGPNDFAAYVLIILGMLVMRLVKKPVRVPLMILVVMMLFLSASRSAWLGAAALVASYVVMQYGRRIFRSKKMLAGVVATVVVAALLFAASLTLPAVRLALFHSSPQDSHLTEGSTDAHWKATSLGVKRVMQRPLGCGLGCAGPASFYGDTVRISENYYVQIAEETGVVGLLVWLGLFASVVAGLWRYLTHDRWAAALLLSAVGLSVVGFWLHVWADGAVSLTWWGLAGLVLGQYASANTDEKVSYKYTHEKTTQKVAAKKPR